MNLKAQHEYTVTGTQVPRAGPRSRVVHAGGQPQADGGRLTRFNELLNPAVNSSNICRHRAYSDCDTINFGLYPLEACTAGKSNGQTSIEGYHSLLLGDHNGYHWH